ncbi:prolyl oligopeptidase family serine peptidase [Porticoccaceae bacterium]|nr:prolyl oligopeptidase family serine peptidase [Porticoccaceae bacterium]
MNKIPKAYGSWPSTISAELITRAAPGLNFLQSHGERLFWTESRPWDAGRNVIICREPDGSIRDLLTAPFSHSSRVHEYGGMAYAADDNNLYFVNAADQRIYQLSLTENNQPVAITEKGPRFADLILDSARQQLVAVCEIHHQEREPENTLVNIVIADGSLSTLASGADFYAYPRISPDSKQLCWIEWQHPNMPWDSTQLWRANLTDNGLTNKTLVAGADNNEAIFQPQWSPDNQLYFVSDKNNWWNIYRIKNDAVVTVLEMEAEFATPLWQFGMCTYDFIDANNIACIWTAKGVWNSGFIHIASGQLSQIDCHYSSMQALTCHQDKLFVVAGAAALSSELISISPYGAVESVYSPATLALDPEDLAEPQSILFSSGDDSDSQQVHAFYYPPTNGQYCGLEGELPPVIALCHGGPTGATDSGLNLKLQYWCNRGFAVVDVNYRGSTGFGRAYRHSLAGAWGIADVQDTQHAVGYLSEQQMVDPQRCLIRGGSAGGYTVLSALTFTDSFQAGASLYGIGDLETLAKDTHKFESRYMDSLIGPYPERRDIYLERSPIHHAGGLNCPVIFLQGLEDKVVPPNQAEMMVKLLQDKGIKVAHITFSDEGHGFRKADNIIRAMESELQFYQEVFNLQAKA